MNIAPRFFCVFLCVLAQLMAISAAGATIITREFTAAWFDPSRPGHGVGIEVIDGAAGKTLLAYWFTYDTDGRQLWLYGTGPVVGDTAQVTVFETQGGSYDGSFDPSQVTQAPWGTLTISFSDCNNGQMIFDPAAAGAASGSMPLIRSTRLFNSACSGGVSDVRFAGTGDTEIVSFLPNIGPFAGASAKAKFEERADRTEFSVELEDLPTGNYSLIVDGTQRATIAVISVAGGTRGEVEFRSPVEPGKLLLTFDPRGAQIEVSNGATALFAGQLGTSNPGPSPTPGPVPLGNALYELFVEPSGNDGPELYAKLEQRSDRVNFSVELEDVAAGSYEILVGGVSRGTLVVVATAGGTEGELEFRDPVEPGKLMLDFDPRGQIIAATRNGSVVLQGTFPNTPI